MSSTLSVILFIVRAVEKIKSFFMSPHTTNRSISRENEQQTTTLVVTPSTEEIVEKKKRFLSVSFGKNKRSILIKTKDKT